MTLPATANAPAGEPAAGILAAYTAHLARTGRGNIAYHRGAAAFLARWRSVGAWAGPGLAAQLRVGSQPRPFLTFLMVSRQLTPGYDYLVARKLSSFWRDLAGSSLEADLRRFVVTAGELGFSERMASGVASQVVARLLIHTGRGLDDLTVVDLDELAPAYPQRKNVTCVPGTLSGLATRLAHLGVVVTDLDPNLTSLTDPNLTSLADLDRRRHIKPYLIALADTPNTKSEGVLSVAEQTRRVHTLSHFLSEITE
ncbi:MAG: hypothetical protein ACRDRH_15750 [Pseudonocardia sp.]